jgi:hypothetical protein
MSVTLTHQAPGSIEVGDSIDFLVAVPSDFIGWTPSARLTGPSQMNHTTVTATGSDVEVYFQGKTGTDALTPGQYMLTVWMANGNDRYKIAQFPLTLALNLSVGSPALAHAVQMLAAVEAAIYARITGNPDGGVEQWAQGGTQMQKLPMRELQALRTKYASEVRRLQNPNQPRPKIKIAFTPSAYIPAGVWRRFFP